ncbi:recombinase family protein [Peribacillus frigoritolerans]|uniref:recombinase family protein n=1 Tax=Peribacillus frigoritolerans TaxID=450367 RepID=UPI0032B4EEDF
MKIFGYARVSTHEQKLDLQLDALNKYGVDEIFQEKMTGTRKDRPKLEEMIKFLREGDKVVVYKLDRISRSTKHLIELTEQFEKLGVHFVSIQDNIDTSTAMGRFYFTIMAGMAQLERDIISERTTAGLKAARARGKLGGRPKADQAKLDYAYHLYQQKKLTVNEICTKAGVSRTSLYRFIDEQKGVAN